MTQPFPLSYSVNHEVMDFEINRPLISTTTEDTPKINQDILLVIPISIDLCVSKAGYELCLLLDRWGSMQLKSGYS